MPFRAEYRLHVQYKQGWATFTREELLDVAPFVGLDILDDSVGQFTLTHVAWFGGQKVKMFLCQSQRMEPDKSLVQVKRMLKAAGWIEVVEARQKM